MKDTHAPVDDEKKRRSASRRAGRPTGSSEPLARTELLSANLLSPYAAALARFYHAAGTADRVRREALRDKRGRHSTPISPAARWNQVRVCVRGDVGCKGNTGVTDQRVTCGRACARLCLRVSERNIHPLGYCELSAISAGLSFFRERFRPRRRPSPCGRARASTSTLESVALLLLGALSSLYFILYLKDQRPSPKHYTCRQIALSS